MLVEDVVDRPVSHAQDLRGEKSDRAHDREPERALDLGHDLPRLGRVFDEIEHAYERPCPDGTDDAEDRVQDELARRDEREGACVERRMIAEIGPRDDGREDARNDDRRERTRREISEDYLTREEHAADRRVECRRNTGGRAAGDERSNQRRRGVRELAEHGTDRGPDLYDRTLAPDAAAERDRRRRCERLDADHARPDDAAVERDRRHHLGDAVAARLGGETCRCPSRDGAARRHDDEQRRRADDVTEPRVENPEGEAAFRGDQPAKRDRTVSAEHAHDDRRSEQIRTLRHRERSDT